MERISIIDTRLRAPLARGQRGQRPSVRELVAEDTKGRFWVLKGSQDIRQDKLASLMKKVEDKGSIDPQFWEPTRE